MKKETKTFFKCDICGGEFDNEGGVLNCEKQHKKERDFDNIEIFELKKEHLDLLKEANIGWDDCEFGAPCIDPKRPYGNSDVEEDIAQIIKLPKKGNYDYEEGMYKEEVMERLSDLHKETQIALQIILQCQTFKLGKYKKLDKYSDKWKFMEENKK